MIKIILILLFFVSCKSNDTDGHYHDQEIELPTYASHCCEFVETIRRCNSWGCFSREVFDCYNLDTLEECRMTRFIGNNLTPTGSCQLFLYSDIEKRCE
jgi:hypothetical protein